MLKRQNRKPFKIPRAYCFFGIFCCLFVTLLVTVEMMNHKFWTNDFVVYYGAVTDFFQGNNPYEHSYGLPTGFFKYAPTTLYLFFPLTGLGFHMAQLLHVALLTGSMIISIGLLHHLYFGKGAQKRHYGLLYAGFGLIAIHLVREFHMGNINLYLLLLFSAGLVAFQKGKNIQAAVFWSFMVVLKPIVILAVIPFFVYQKWNVILVMLGMGVLFALLPLVHIGFGGTTNLWVHWFDAISSHGDYIQSEGSLRYLFNRYTGLHSEWGASLVVLTVLVAVMVWTRIRRSRFVVADWVVICFAFCPNFFVTDTEHFLLTLPLLLLLIAELIRERKLIWWACFGTGVLFFSFNSNDLLGSALNNALYEMGLPGMANMWFILLLILLKSRKLEDTKTRKAEEPTERLEQTFNAVP